MPVRRPLARRARDRITADTAIVERQRVELGKLLARRALTRAFVALRLVGEPEPAPELRPQVAIEAGERARHLLGVLAADILERIEAAGAAHELGLDLVQRAPRRRRIRLRGCAGGDRA